MNFGDAVMKVEEKQCFSNCLWKLGQVLSNDF